MHTHCLGQTGTGKTRSVIEPLILQDLLRKRGVVVVDGKGAQENEERLAAMAAAAGRLGDLKVFTLNPFHASHTYNPLHLTAGADPRAVAERVFSSFADDMDNPYYRDQSRMFFVTLVSALAGTGQRFSMLDAAAAIASPDSLDHALCATSDARARRSIRTQMERLGSKARETFTGLLSAVNRYDHPAVNAYDPDIILEDEIDRGGILGFFLPANYYKQLARYIGLVVFQHIQQVGALRQLDRSRCQRPVYVYADEFYTFAYEGFTDAVNKLRDANVSILLAHQTFSDLEKVSKAYADGIWDNTRNKVILYQNQFEVCDRIAKALGTEKEVELTVRRSVDRFLNSTSMLEASSRQVDAYRLHPNRIKSLACGQGYLAQDASYVGVNLQPLPDAFFAQYAEARPGPPKTARVEGLRLHERFVNGPEGPQSRRGDMIDQDPGPRSDHRVRRPEARRIIRRKN
jgi:type IV secretory pathway TraG/TraD family ATPase VirD4